MAPWAGKRRTACRSHGLSLTISLIPSSPSPWLRQSLNESLRALLTELHAIWAAPGTAVTHQGEVGDSVFIVAEGTCEMRHLREGHAADLHEAALHESAGEVGAGVGDHADEFGVYAGELKPGDVFGDAYTGDHRHLCTVVSRGHLRAADTGSPGDDGSDEVDELGFSLLRPRRRTSSVAPNATLVLHIRGDVYRRCTEKLRHSPVSVEAARAARRAEGLSELRLFTNWKQSDIDFFAQIMRERVVATGDNVYTAGSPPEAFYFVLTGSVAMRAQNPRSTTNSTEVELVHAPVYFGEEALDPHHATAGMSTTAVGYGAAGAVLGWISVRVARNLFDPRHGAPRSSLKSIKAGWMARKGWRAMRLLGRDHMAGVPTTLLDGEQEQHVLLTKFPRVACGGAGREGSLVDELEEQERRTEIKNTGKAILRSGLSGNTPTYSSLSPADLAVVHPFASSKELQRLHRRIQPKPKKRSQYALEESSARIRRIARQYYRVIMFVAKVARRRREAEMRDAAAYEMVKTRLRRSSVAGETPEQGAARRAAALHHAAMQDSFRHVVDDAKALSDSQKKIRATAAAAAGVDLNGGGGEDDERPVVANLSGTLELSHKPRRRSFTRRRRGSADGASDSSVGASESTLSPNSSSTNPLVTRFSVVQRQPLMRLSVSTELEELNPLEYARGDFKSMTLTQKREYLERQKKQRRDVAATRKKTASQMVASGRAAADATPAHARPSSALRAGKDPFTGGRSGRADTHRRSSLFGSVKPALPDAARQRSKSLSRDTDARGARDVGGSDASAEAGTGPPPGARFRRRRRSVDGVAVAGDALRRHNSRNRSPSPVGGRTSRAAASAHTLRTPVQPSTDGGRDADAGARGARSEPPLRAVPARERRASHDAGSRTTSAHRRRRSEPPQNFSSIRRRSGSHQRQLPALDHPGGATPPPSDLRGGGTPTMDQLAGAR